MSLAALNKPFEPLDRGKVAKLLRQEDAKTFIEWLRTRIREEGNQLEGASDLLTVGRHQGRIEALKSVLKFREEL